MMFRRLHFAFAFSVLMIGSTIVVAQPPTTQYLPANAIGMLRVRPAELIQSPALELFPIEFFSAMGLQAFKINLSDLDTVVAAVGLDENMQPQYGIIASSKVPYNIRKNISEMGARCVDAEIPGYDAAFVQQSPFTIAQFGESTFYIGSESYLVPMAESQPGPLSTIAERVEPETKLFVAAALEPVREISNDIARKIAYAIHPDLQAIAELPPLLEGLTIRAELDQTISLQINLRGNDAAAAEVIQTTLSDCLDSAGRLMVLEFERTNSKSFYPVSARKALLNYAQRMSKKVADEVRPQRDGLDVNLRLDSQIQWAAAGVAWTLALPTLEGLFDGFQRSTPSNQFKQIGLAMHNYHSAFRELPAAAFCDPDGNPLLSWRVKILPFLEEQALYEQFNLDEPWDSENNLPLSEQMPLIYRVADVDLPENHTVIQAIAGENIGIGKNEAIRFRDMLDGLSNTIMVAEVNADQAVIWSKPDDVVIDSEKPLEFFGGNKNGDFHALFSDGAVRKMAATLDAELFWALLTRAGKEVVQIPER